MWAFDPDVVHLASPAWLGLQAALAARSRSVPVVAVYQTDLIGFAERYPFPGGAAAMRRLTRSVHGSVDRTLVPSTASRDQLASLGVGRLHRWGRGVDTELFAPSRRTDELRAQLGAEHLVGYVGRLAAGEGARSPRRRAGPARHPARRRRRRARGRTAALRAAPGEPSSACARAWTSPGSSPPSTCSAHRSHRDLLPVRAGGARLRCAGRRAARGRSGRPGERGRQRLPLPTRGGPRSCASTSLALLGRSGTARAPGWGRARSG